MTAAARGWHVVIPGKGSAALLAVVSLEELGKI